MGDSVVFDYLNPDVPPGLRLLDVPLVRADAKSLKGYGEIVRDPKKHRIEIVPWPLVGWRRLDAGTGIEGGTARKLAAGDWVLVPEKTPHWFTQIDGTLVLMSIHLPK